MNCGDCKNWMQYKAQNNIGCCVTTSLTSHRNDGDHCTIAEPKSPEPELDREWTAEERDAAEHPRVGDHWDNGRGADWEITAISNGVILYEKLISVPKKRIGTGEVEREYWVENLHRAWRSYLVSRGPAPVQPKPLRDGDVVYDPKCSSIWVVADGSFFDMSRSNINPSLPVLCNLVAMRECFESGGRLLMVKDGEVGVALTRDEAEKLIDSANWDMARRAKAEEFRSARDKIAAAMEKEVGK